jgi:2-polyprenyl-3-methyl-5-hydroxy-6-metoxy-1,4-benzoquinol methylase
MKSNVGWDNYKDKNIHVFNENNTQVINQKMPNAFFQCLLDILDNGCMAGPVK